jgi:cell wall-associated NlpC family hydrolase
MGYSDEKYANAIKTACPVLSGKAKDCNDCKWDGCRCFDCRGFTRWILQQVGISLEGGGATTQYESNSNWVEKGKIANMPRDLVCCVFKYKDGRMSHTGLHLGNGYIIHCSTIVKEDKLPGTPAWTHYGIPAGLYTN